MSVATAGASESDAPRSLPAAPTAAVPPSVLAASLESLPLADLREDDLVEAIAGWERVASAVAARQAEAIAELVARRGARERRFVADEVACALACTRRAAELKVELADGLTAFPDLADGLARGGLDVRKVRGWCWTRSPASGTRWRVRWCGTRSRPHRE